MNAVLWWAAENTIAVAALLPFVLMLCRLFRRRPAVQHLLWMLLMAKLVTPPVVDWPWNPREMLTSVSASKTTPTLETPVAAPSVVPFESEGVMVPLLERDDLPGQVSAATQSTSDPPAPVSEPIAAHEWSLSQILVTVWAIGATTLIALGGRALWRQTRLLRSANAPSALLLAALEQAAERMRMRPLPIAVSERVLSPLICCLGRAWLVWPRSMDAPERIVASDAILAHELAHVARRDHLTVYFEFAVLALHWWNPLAWFIRRKLAETRELACDALALDGAQQARGEYAQRLLDLTVASPHAMPLASAFGAGMFSRRFLQRRLTMVFDSRTSGRVSTAGVVLAGLMAAVALPGFSWAQSTATNEVQTTEAQETATVDDAPPAPTATTSSELTVPMLRDIEYVGQLFTNKVQPAGRGNEGGGTIETKPAPESAAPGIKVMDSIRIPAGSTFTLRRDKNSNRFWLAMEGEDGTDQVLDLGNVQTENVSSGAVEWVLAPVKPGTDPLVLSRDVRWTERSPAVPNPRVEAPLNWHPYQPGTPDLALLKSELELAQLNVEEKKAELVVAVEEHVSEAKRRLAEIAIRRAEIEWQRCKLKLEQAESQSARPAVRN